MAYLSTARLRICANTNAPAAFVHYKPATGADINC